MRASRDQTGLLATRFSFVFVNEQTCAFTCTHRERHSLIKPIKYGISSASFSISQSAAPGVSGANERRYTCLLYTSDAADE